MLWGVYSNALLFFPARSDEVFSNRTRQRCIENVVAASVRPENIYSVDLENQVTPSLVNHKGVPPVENGDPPDGASKSPIFFFKGLFAGSPPVRQITVNDGRNFLLVNRMSADLIFDFDRGDTFWPHGICNFHLFHATRGINFLAASLQRQKRVQLFNHPPSFYTLRLLVMAPGNGDSKHREDPTQAYI